MGVFARKSLQKQSNNCLFANILAVFKVKSVPNVPGVSLVPWYSTFPKINPKLKIRNGVALLNTVENKQK